MIFFSRHALVQLIDECGGLSVDPTVLRQWSDVHCRLEILALRALTGCNDSARPLTLVMLRFCLPNQKQLIDNRPLTCSCVALPPLACTTVRPNDSSAFYCHPRKPIFSYRIFQRGTSPCHPPLLPTSSPLTRHLLCYQTARPDAISLCTCRLGSKLLSCCPLALVRCSSGWGGSQSPCPRQHSQLGVSLRDWIKTGPS